MNIQELYQLYLQYPCVTTDTRKPVRDSIFFALHGENYDGNQFAAEALNKGAAYAVVDDQTLSSDNRFLMVHDTLIALQELATYHRSKLSTGVIAVTGSNGKTTTKELIYRILSQKYNTFATHANLNNHIGVPLTILGIKKEHQIGVVEMGANNAGEIMKLCHIAQPGYGLITNIGRAHIEGFGSLEGVKKTKKELYDYLDGTHGCIFLRGDNKILTDMIVQFPGGIVKYGDCDESVCRAEILEKYPYLALHVYIGKNADTPLKIQSNLVGDYNRENILAAVSVGTYFSISNEKIKRAIEGYNPEFFRSQFKKTKSNRIILDAYNANPTSMEAALKNFYHHPGPNKILILGEMKELGDSSGEEHAKLINLIHDMGFKYVFLVGESFQGIDKPADWRCFGNVEEMISALQKKPLNDTTILLKGSRAVQLEKLLPYL
jgi:UDP-N-acetylmuramoyl-tripeptide--D-alanyl-D-alanine ligase